MTSTTTITTKHEMERKNASDINSLKESEKRGSRAKKKSVERALLF